MIIKMLLFIDMDRDMNGDRYTNRDRATDTNTDTVRDRETNPDPSNMRKASQFT
jgi:hypothetical protein